MLVYVRQPLVWLEDDPAHPAGLLRTVAIIATCGWAAALASMMFGDWLLPFAYNQGIGGYGYVAYSWMFLGLLISVHRLNEQHRTTQLVTTEAHRP